MTGRFLSAALAGLAVLALSACASFMQTAPAGALAGDPDFAVTLQAPWTRIPARSNRLTRGDLLTRDGLALNQVHLVSLAGGEPLLHREVTDVPPLYRAGKRLHAQVGLIMQSLEALGYHDLEAKAVRPVMLDGAEGLRFEIAGRFESGIKLRGLAALAETGERLHILVFIAPAGHYHQRDAREIEAMIDSLSFR
jgi:hypothetical protein